MWEIGKETLDLPNNMSIEVIVRKVPGVLNASADLLSRPDLMNSGWTQALTTITSKWGSLEKDGSKLFQDPEGMLGELKWAGFRTLLKPRVENISEAVDILGALVKEEEQDTPQSTWKSLVVLITLSWKGTK